MKISILIPSYNEIKTLPVVLEKLKSVSLSMEAIIVDDGSSDGTGDWIEKAVGERRFPYEIKYFRHPKNEGKGAALITAAGKASGEICVIQDADLEYDPKYIEEIVRPIIRDGYEVVYGSRLLSEESETYSLFYLWGNIFLTFLNNFFFGTKMTDSYTGYKAFRTDVLRKLNLSSRGFEIEAEISAKISMGGFRFKEVPIVYSSRNREEGKKINFSDAVKGVLKIFGLWISSKKDRW